MNEMTPELLRKAQVDLVMNATDTFGEIPFSAYNACLAMQMAATRWEQQLRQLEAKAEGLEKYKVFAFRFREWTNGPLKTGYGSREAMEADDRRLNIIEDEFDAFVADEPPEVTNPAHKTPSSTAPEDLDITEKRPI